eukprot:6483691-Amphidinium_carterae.5
MRFDGSTLRSIGGLAQWFCSPPCTRHAILLSSPRTAPYIVGSIVILRVDCDSAQDGDWRKQYPPWGEADVATSGAPQVFVPILGPFTRHSCYPSRYMSADLSHQCSAR